MVEAESRPLRVLGSGGHFTRLERERDFSVGVCKGSTGSTVPAQRALDAPGPTP